MEQLASLLVQAGHGEKSVSIYQCLLELNLFSPVLPGPGSYSLEDKLSLLEPVWDSGVARVGEGGARGWGSRTRGRAGRLWRPPGS